MGLRCAIIGSGNIGTDLMVKMLRSEVLDLRALVGIDPDSDGLARARSMGVEASHEGPDWVLDNAGEFDMIFDATSAYVHVRYYKKYAEAGITAIDLTPAARGPKSLPQ
jgi:Acetaldehyde dehydrogenase (acetylating)